MGKGAFDEKIGKRGKSGRGGGRSCGEKDGGGRDEATGKEMQALADRAGGEFVGGVLAGVLFSVTVEAADMDEALRGDGCGKGGVDEAGSHRHENRQKRQKGGETVKKGEAEERHRKQGIA